ncbi:hypothetical protein [Arthrobacter sp. HS15c]|uniref:hypothetical protein n=1 Tax=Arthrobacter sp. HS15c TaxID=3230279 RepID=UPI003466FFED
MDAESRLDQFPRNLFFQAVDHQTGPAALPESEVKVIQNKRFADARRLHTQLEHLVRALKSVESFDVMGNAGLAAVNLDDLELDIHKQIRNFIREIEAAEDRYGDAIDAERGGCGHSADRVCDNCEPEHIESHAPKTPAAATPTPQALAAAGPTRLDGTPGPSPAAVAAQIKANLGLALDRVSR